MQVRGLCKTYQNRTGLFRRQAVEAIKPLSFDLGVGQTLAIVGEAGSGKSTLARILAGMIEPSGGEIAIEGQPLVDGDYQTRCKLLRMIFQDPNTSLNRKIRVGQILETPLRLNTALSEEERREKVIQTLRMVGMLADHALFIPRCSPPVSSSGWGWRGRSSSIPKIVVADEALSTLDISVRSQIINLLLEMQETTGLSYVLVANDWASSATSATRYW